MDKIAVALVNFNTCTHLRACLETVKREGAGEVAVVDNASNDGSIEMVRGEFPWVTLVSNERNPGYGAGANQAIDACQAEYVLLLNSDTRLQPGALEGLSDYLDQHPQVAIAGPRLVNLDGSLQPSCYPFPTPFNLFLEESTLGKWIGRLPALREGYLRTWSHSKNRAVPWVLGAALAIRRRAFDEVGGFDPSYFIYAEEVDLCYRMTRLGWQIHYTPQASVTHIGGASTRQRRAEMSMQYFLSMEHFYRQHYSPLRRAQFFTVMKIIALFRWLRDQALLRLTRESRQKGWFSENVTVWQRIMRYRGQEEGLGER